MTPSQVQLRSVQIEGFRSCQGTSLDLNGRLSVLIGPNGAGKTNILLAITLLRPMARPIFAGDVTMPATSQCRVMAEFTVGRARFSSRLTLRYTFDEENKERILTSSEEWRLGGLNDKGASPGPWLGEGTLFPGGMTVGIGALSRAFRQRMLPEIEGPKEHKLLSKHAKQAQTFRSRISYYSASQFTNPARCPSSIEIDQQEGLVSPLANRREHERLLRDMFRLRENNPASYSAYISLVGKHGLNLISAISWRQVKVASSQVEVRTGGKVEKHRRQRVLVVPSVQIGPDRLSFNQLSEGTFRTLALIFYLITDDNELLLIEEPEVCVHHGLLASVVELIKGQSVAKQIIFSTHSDFVLDEVEPDQVFIVSRTNQKGTLVRSLSKGYPNSTIDALKEYLKNSGNLGDFWRHGGF